MSEKKSTLAIIGSGLAGLASGFEYLQIQPSKGPIDFYYTPQHPSASLVASGLLHLFHGVQARIPDQGREALALVLNLIKTLEEDSSSIAQPTPMLRPSKNHIQQSMFQARSKQYPEELKFGDFDVDGHIFKNALMIDQAWIINTPIYMEKLRLFLEKHSCTFIEQTAPKDLLDRYERVIIAAGAQTLELMKKLSGEELPSSLETILTKGQVALCDGVKPPSVTLNARTYIIPGPHPNSVLCGATFERTFSTADPQPSPERSRVWQEGVLAWPTLSRAKVTWKSGVRLSGPSHKPFIASYQGKLFVISGLGSKGLIYHRLMAQKLMKVMHHSSSNKRWEFFPLKTLVDDISL